MTLADRIHQSQSRPHTGNFDGGDIAPAFTVDYLPFLRRAGGADPAFRQECIAALRDYFRRIGHVARLTNLLDTRAAYAALQAEGFDVLSTEERERAFEQYSDAAIKEAAKAKLHSAILSRLEKDTEPGARRLGLAVIAEFQQDLDQLGRSDAPLVAKYGAPAARQPLADALLRAIDKLAAMVAADHNLRWHWDPIMALNHAFPESAPLRIDETPSPAVASAPPRPTSSLRSTADIARAR